MNEALPGFLTAPPRVDGCGEEWSLRKVVLRVLRHDRLYARAMYRRTRAIWGEAIPDIVRIDG